MPYKYQKQLIEKASEFITYLSKYNILADIVSESFREYSVKLNVFDYGTVNLFYSPNKNSYSATFQEFKNKEKAAELKNLWNEMQGISPSENNNIYTDKDYEIDVDGSYQDGITTYAAIIRKNGKIIEELSGIVDVVDVDGSYQVAGEIKAVTEAIYWCEGNNVKEITLYHDYNGLEYWATGKWKTKKKVSKAYSEFMKHTDINIKWVKIESHTGAKWNEYADRLAKSSKKGLAL